MRYRPIWVAALVVVAGGIAAPIINASVAQADTAICEQYGSTTIQDKYIVANNRWGSDAEQCINVTSTGFSITSQQGSTSGGAPLSYPSIYVGCHYDSCSPGTNLPMQLSEVASVPSSIDYTYTSGTFDAAYDVWMDPTAKTTGVNEMEMMIWFNRQGGVQPVGSSVGTTTIGGLSWDVWTGNNGGNDVVSYVASSTLASWSFDILDFVNDVDARTQVTTSWYLTSVQAGFEPWSGGVGLAVNSFSADVNTGTPTPTPTTTTTTSPTTSPSTSQEIVGQGSGRCLDIKDYGTTDGSPVQLWDCYTGTNQLWSLHRRHLRESAVGQVPGCGGRFHRQQRAGPVVDV